MKITVYTTANCVQCNSTKRYLDKNNIEYETVDLNENPEAMAMVKEMGYSAAPVVIAGDKHWSGFRIEKIKNLIAEIHLANGHESK